MTTPQEAARTALARAMWGVGRSETLFQGELLRADSILATLQADPDAARAVVALLGGEGDHSINNEAACWCKPVYLAGHWRHNHTARSAAPQDDREAEVAPESDALFRYREALGRGLSDAEARAEGWPEPARSRAVPPPFDPALMDVTTEKPDRECFCEGEFIWACGPQCECWHHRNGEFPMGVG